MMETNEIGALYAEATAKYGLESQLLVTVEELSELTHQIFKLLRSGTPSACLAAKIAGVEIMLTQLKLAYPALVNAVDYEKIIKFGKLRDRLAQDAAAPDRELQVLWE